MENKKIVEKKLRKVKSSIFIVKPQSYFEDKWHTKVIELTLDLRQAPGGGFLHVYFTYLILS